jgi:Contractile injection system tube protein
MSGFSRSPRLMKGAIIISDLANPSPHSILFQYNPETMSRTLQGQSGGGSGGEGSTTESFRLKGPPTETINLEIELDATDNLERPDQNGSSATMGIYPQLATLEMIMYPKIPVVTANRVLAAIGTIEIIAPEGPFVIFVWGPNRVIPIRLTEFKVTEEAYDTNLNPIRAKVSLGLRVLSYADLDSTHPGYNTFLAYQKAKEVMAGLNPIKGNMSPVVGSEFSISAGVRIG